LVNAGMIAAALPIFKAVFAQDKNWAILVQRLPQAELLTASGEDLQQIVAQANTA
jgi:hypothetical protein